MNYTELIHQYISGALSPADKAAFEAQLQTNAELKKQYEAQVQVIKGIRRMGLQSRVRSSFKKAKRGKMIRKSAIAITTAILVTGAVLLIRSGLNTPRSQVLYELNEQGNKHWAEADRQLEAQVFRINPLRDTVIETKQGIIVSVPAGSFIDKFGASPTAPVDMEMKEAMNAFDIMKAGLNTMGDGRLLETGGMFYINARVGNDNLAINQSKPLTAGIPANSNNASMMLFDGERMADGSINWKDPKPLARQVSTVNILSLDFYPDHFLDSVQAMGFDRKNKIRTDSIYYSFGCHNFHATEDTSKIRDVAISDSVFAPEIINTVTHIKPGSDGARLFKMNCAVCHALGTEKLTGPGMAGLMDRVPKPAMAWLEAFILNNEKVIKSGDAYANKIYNENGKAAMTVFEGQLNRQDVNCIIRYMTGQGGYNINNCGPHECPEIDPARIHAIWDKKFNGTILATKEFEARLKTVFKTCNPCVLDLYVNNLDKNLYELDSIAATMTGGTTRIEFLDFYAEKAGGVSITNKEMKKLQAYVDQKKAIYAKAAEDAMKRLYANEQKLGEKANDARTSHSTEEWKRDEKTFNEELTLNMKDAYRQLGKPYPYDTKRPPSKPGTYLTASISNTGWKNVDAYVFEATANRASMSYMDPGSGKKAELKYEPISITVKDFSSYDRVVSYMIPDKLSSFQKMKHSESGFTETLNGLLDYSVVVVGFKGSRVYFYPVVHAKHGEYTVGLYSTGEGEINTRFAFMQGTGLERELNYQRFEQRETIRVQKIREREEVTRRLWPVVFPCAAAPAQAMVQESGHFSK